MTVITTELMADAIPKANTKDCKECKYFHISDPEKKPTCTFNENYIEHCAIVVKDLASGE